MPEFPRISIITPSFNQGQFLEETIRSVLLQDYPAIEYIIIDGGSTDNSRAIIKKYKNKLAWFISETDSGQADAINKGFERATGEFVAWLNSDDIYAKNAISSAVKELKSNPDCGMVFSNVLSIDSESSIFNTMMYGNWGLGDLMQFKIIGQPGVFIRKEVLEDVGFLNSNFHYLLDHHLWLKIASKYPIKHVDKFWAAARFHPTAKNVAHAEEFGKEAFRICEWMEKQPDLVPLYQKNKKKINAGAYLLNARYLLDSEKSWKAFKNYIISITLDVRSLPREINRIAYSLLNSLIPLEKLKENYLQKRAEIIKKGNYEYLIDYLQEDKEV
ncbi:MAG: glycosyltransferase [Anaerolineaceae bacterium]|nr:glycosyltransferase [Anaerolineaceae bacterium]